jgi:hypothetical protein
MNRFRTITSRNPNENLGTYYLPTGVAVSRLAPYNFNPILSLKKATYQ